MFQEILNNDVNTLKIMGPYILLGLLIVFTLVIGLKFADVIFGNARRGTDKVEQTKELFDINSDRGRNNEKEI